RGGWPAVSGAAMRLHNPLGFRRAGPAAFTAAAIGVEDPGLDLIRLRVPGDDHEAAGGWLALDLHAVIANEIPLALPPPDGRGDLAVVGLIDPFADHPLELLEPLIGCDALHRCGVVANLGDLPGTTLPGEQRDEPIGDRGLLGRNKA